MTALDTAPEAQVDPAVAGVLLVGFEGTSAPDWLRRWAAQGLAGVCLFARNCASREQVASLVAELRAERPDLLVAVDEEGGSVTRLETETGSTLPGSSVLGALDDPAATAAVAALTGDRLRAAGVDVNLAPVADVNVNPQNPVIGVRSFGADPELVSRHVAAYVSGLQSRGVAACAKHFPGHGDTAVDSHLAVPTVDHDRPTLDRVDLAPFRAAVSAGTRAVMTAHLDVPALDTELATLSRAILTDLLRDELGFGGVVATDALEMQAVAGTVGIGTGAVLSLRAGADLICTGLRQSPGQLAADGLASALAAGELDRDRLEEAGARVQDLAAWSAEQRGRASWPPAPAVDVAEVVRRAAVVRDPAGRLPLPGPVVVAEVSSPVFTGTGGAGARLDPALPATVVQVHGEASRVAEVLREARGRSLVAVVRDLATVPGSRRVLEELLAERPDAVVVLTGLADDAALLPLETTSVAVHGAGAVHLDVAAELLTPAR